MPHITCNKNTVPNDPRSPFVTSGVRLGTPAVTTRGLKEDDMDMIAECIALVLQSEDNIEKSQRNGCRADCKISSGYVRNDERK